MEFAPLATREPMVSAFSSLDTKELVKQATDIVELVGSYNIQLRRAGRAFKGLCPWHDDSSPSLQVNPERQSFKCWVCDIGGDVFSFVMKMEGVEFPEAMAMLADRAGVELKPTGRRAEPGSASDKRTLFQAMAWAEEQFHQCLLQSPDAQPARNYLSQRSIGQESIEKFHLGFAPDHWDWIVKRARNTEFSAKILEAIGLVAPRESGGFYDRFKGRVLFSIRDAQGRPVGLGGRVLPELPTTSPAKYINSPETLLFSKSRLLYGLDTAKDAMRGSRRALVMEGYTDCIVAHQYGFGDAVAVLGTALGDRHIQTLRRFVDRIVLVLDGDEAGQRRANEVLELFIAQQADLRIVTLPSGMDPCDYLQNEGADAFSNLLENNAVDALEHAFRVETGSVDLHNDLHGANQALERLLTVIAKAPRLTHATTTQHRNREWSILSTLAQKFRVPEENVRDRIAELRRRPIRRPAPTSVSVPSDFDPSGMVESDEAPARPSAPIGPWQREFIEILLLQPGLVARVAPEIRPEQLPAEPCRRIYATCCRLAEEGIEPDFDRLMLEFNDPTIQTLLVELAEQGQAKAAADPAALLDQLIAGFHHREVERSLPEQEAALRERRLDDGEELDLLNQLVQQQRNRQGISDPKDG